MDLIQAMQERHSVRRYLSTPIEKEKADILRGEIEKINSKTGLHFSLYLEEPNAFQANKPEYGSFQGCRNYIALIGKRGEDEAVGYYGEQLVLLAQTLGLNTCWVALTYDKSGVAAVPAHGEKIYDLLALGYGATQGHPHQSKPADKVSDVKPDSPEWYKKGIEAVLLAPTAINQQRFFFSRVGERGVRVKGLLGPCYKTDLGIVKYHFELGAGKDHFEWI